MSGQMLAEVLGHARHALAEAGIEDPSREARLLVMAAADLSAAALIAREDKPLGDHQLARISAFLARRIRREPLSRIEGKRGFFGLDLHIGPGVLDPRPETEHLVEAALTHIGGARPADILDIGTGSGAILLAVLHACPLARGTGVDISGDALVIAGNNADRLGLAGRARFLQSDLFSGVTGRFDVILSNPPYIPAGLALTLAPEVLNFDPPLALFAEGDGLIFYRQILERAHDHLVPGGLIGFEVGHDQALRVADLLRHAGYYNVSTLTDYAGHERCVLGFAA